MSDDDRMDRKEAARRLGVTTAYLCASLDRRFLHPIREGKRVFYERADVENALVRWKRERVRKEPGKPFDVRERFERGRISKEVATILQGGGNWQDCLATVGGDVQWMREAYEAYYSDPLEEKAQEAALKWFRMRNNEISERRDKYELSLKRLRIREQLAAADLERAKRGEQSSTVFQTNATTTEDGAPALPPIPRAPRPPKPMNGPGVVTAKIAAKIEGITKKKKTG